MKTEPVIHDITDARDLEKAIASLNDNQLLIIDFWAPWCAPCKSLTPVLEAVAAKFAPDVILAKINVDDNQMLATHFKIQSIPSVKFIQQGKIVHQFTGAQSADAIEKIIKSFLPEQPDSSDILEDARHAFASGEYHQAGALLREYLDNEPASSEAMLLSARCQLLLNHYADARAALDALDDVSKITEKDHLTLVCSLLEKFSADNAAPEAAAAVKESPADLSRVFDWARALAASGDFPAAFEALLSIIRSNKNFDDGSARKLLVALFELIGKDSPLVQEYRKRLATILFV